MSKCAIITLLRVADSMAYKQIPDHQPISRCAICGQYPLERKSAAVTLGVYFPIHVQADHGIAISCSGRASSAESSAVSAPSQASGELQGDAPGGCILSTHSIADRIHGLGLDTKPACHRYPIETRAARTKAKLNGQAAGRPRPLLRLVTGRRSILLQQ